MPYKATILDDHPLMLESMKMMAQATGLFDQVEGFTSWKSFLESGVQLHQDCYLADISLGEEDGREIIKNIRKKCPNSKIIAISSHDNPRIIKSAYKAGADSYLLKTTPIQEIILCIKTLMNGEEFMSASVQKILNQHLKNSGGILQSHFPLLSDRELEVLNLIIEEHTSKEIAEKLFLSEHTVESHRANLFHKFDAKNLAGLVIKAVRAGLVD